MRTLNHSPQQIYYNPVLYLLFNFYAKKKTSSCRELCDTVPFNEADLLRNDDILIYEPRPKYQR